MSRFSGVFRDMFVYIVVSAPGQGVYGTPALIRRGMIVPVGDHKGFMVRKVPCNGSTTDFLDRRDEGVPEDVISSRFAVADTGLVLLGLHGLVHLRSRTTLTVAGQEEGSIEVFAVLAGPQVGFDVLVGENRTSDRRDRDRLFRHPHFLDDLRHEFMHYTVAAAGAVMHRSVIQQGRLVIDYLSFLYYFFSCHGFKV